MGSGGLFHGEMGRDHEVTAAVSMPLGSGGLFYAFNLVDDGLVG